MRQRLIENGLLHSGNVAALRCDVVLPYTGNEGCEVPASVNGANIEWHDVAEWNVPAESVDSIRAVENNK